MRRSDARKVQRRTRTERLASTDGYFAPESVIRGLPDFAPFGW
jgi:hypothetical protein